MQLRGGAVKQGLHIDVIHLAELMARHLKKTN
jgi:hypothetical protein